MRLTIAVVTLLASTEKAATALPHGDCDADGATEINEVQRCANVFVGVQLLDTCVACDADGSMTIGINEVQGVANCFLDAAGAGCRMLSEPTASVTATPAATDTPEPTLTLPATATPEATSTPAATFTATFTQPAATPTAVAAVCGNGDVEPGETCDDGNTVNGDSCPSDCEIVSCATDGTMRLANVNYQSPVSLLSITLIVEYPDGVIQIPGTGTDASVGQRVTNRAPGLASFVDFNYALRGSISGSNAFPSTRAFSINFDNCQGAVVPAPEDFTCTVIEAVNTQFANVAGVTCSVALP